MLTRCFVPGSALTALVQPGLGAVLKADRALIAEEQRPRVGDSLDLDSATRQGAEQENRWDYLLCIPDTHELVAFEPHSPAKDSEIPVMIRKKDHARDILRANLAPKRAVARWIWVTRGEVSFLKMEKARKRLEQAGIRFDGRLVKSWDD